MVRLTINNNRSWCYLVGLLVLLAGFTGIYYFQEMEGFGANCAPCRVAATGYNAEISEPHGQVGGYPFAFINQLDSTRSRYAPRPNCWPKDRSCDLEWNRPETPNPCKRQDLRTYFGSGIPIKTDEVCTRESDGESMFYFKNFRSSPACCPSPYSTEGGCVCAFEKKVCQKWPQDLSKDPERITFT